MRKAAGILLVLIGAVLIVSALLLFSFNRHQEAEAGRAADEKLAQLRSVMASEITRAEPEKESPPVSVIPDRQDNPPEEITVPETLSLPVEPSAPETEAETVPETETAATEPRIGIDGYEYIGYLYMEAIGVEVPVMADWDYTRLNIAPCRHFGSALTDDLVIAGHDYRTHFAYIGQLKQGDRIIFTDVLGTVYNYTVEKSEILAADAVDAVQNSGYDLVLYTCTYTGTSRITVFASRTAEETEPRKGE